VGLAATDEERPGQGKGQCNRQTGRTSMRTHCGKYLAKGMSFAEIAEAINAKFKTAYSRNAAIGRARRMGIASPDRAKDLPKVLARGAESLTIAAFANRANAITRLHPADATFERTENRQAPLRRDRSAPLFRFTELEPDDCRYPYGGDQEGEAITFCGRPAAPRLKLLRSTFSI